MSRIFATMAVPPPAITVAEAEAFALARWNIAGAAHPLRGERDRNFRIAAEAGGEYVLKFANPAEEPLFREMQIAALDHIARRDPELPVPRIVPLPDGGAEAGFPHASGTVLRARLLTWLPGLPIDEAAPTRALRNAYGAAVARMQDALAGFDHPARDHEMSWDLQHAPRLREIAFAITHGAARATLLELLDEYDARVRPVLPRLARQIVHNDLNRLNVLVDPGEQTRLAGIIDFGDIALTATLFDLAIAVSSAPRGEASWQEVIAEVAEGYRTRRKLAAWEAGLLPQLTATRFALGMALAFWQRHAQPDNAHFDLSPEFVGRRLDAIAQLRALSAAGFAA